MSPRHPIGSRIALIEPILIRRRMLHESLEPAMVPKLVDQVLPEQRGSRRR